MTGGTGSIGSATARAILAKGGIVAVGLHTTTLSIWLTLSLLDMVPDHDGRTFALSLSDQKAFYFRVDITDKAALAQVCEEILATVPRGSLAGAVHCAGYSPSRPWSHKVKDSIDVSSFAISFASSDGLY